MVECEVKKDADNGNADNGNISISMEMPIMETFPLSASCFNGIADNGNNLS